MLSMVVFDLCYNNSFQEIFENNIALQLKLNCICSIMLITTKIISTCFLSRGYGEALTMELGGISFLKDLKTDMLSL